MHQNDMTKESNIQRIQRTYFGQGIMEISNMIIMLSMGPKYIHQLMSANICAKHTSTHSTSTNHAMMQHTQC